MKKFIVLVLAIIVIVLVYSGLKNDPARDDRLVIPPVTIPLAMQNDSGETGQVLLAEVDGQVEVTVTLVNAPADSVQPAHIHRGSCAVLGDVVYPLSSVTAGTSKTTITASLDALKSNLPLAINVHQSTTEAGNYVACGDLNF